MLDFSEERKMRKKSNLFILVVISVCFIGQFTELFAFDSVEDISLKMSKYITYYKTIELTDSQKSLKDRALKKIKAPCCKDRTMDTCCCPCNLAKSVWGLSAYLITKENVNENQLILAVNNWIKISHQGKIAGDSCYKGHCTLPVHKDGCGGMDDKNIIN